MRKASTRLEVVGFDEATGIPVHESERTNAEDRTEESEYMARIREAFNCLPERQRRVFALVDMEGESQGEAAEFLNMKPSTLRSTLHFARRRMAQLLASLEVMQ
jgi:RNA polymerase sigma factor (sigma-70 family)